jgi:type IV secretion system protein TrbG
MQFRSPFPEKTYMASVSWIYPRGELIALAATPIATALDLNSLHFRMRSKATIRPGGRFAPLMTEARSRSSFPAGIGQGEMPPLFIIGPEGKTSELVNYRVRGSHMIVDRLFAAAELRLAMAVRTVRAHRPHQ